MAQMKIPECSNGEDRIFWERLADMPWLEAEQECVLRREDIVLQINMLNSMRTDIGKSSAKAKELGRAQFDCQSQLVMLNEQIKYLRKIQDQVKWRRAVETLFGREACEQCVVWIAQQTDAIMG